MPRKQKYDMISLKMEKETTKQNHDVCKEDEQLTRLELTVMLDALRVYLQNEVECREDIEERQKIIRSALPKIIAALGDKIIARLILESGGKDA